MSKVPEMIPVSNLRQDTAAVLKRVQAAQQPLVITQRGRAAAIMLRTLIHINLLACKVQRDALVLVRNTFHGGMELQTVTSMKMKLAI